MATLLSTATLIADKYEVLSLLAEGCAEAVYKVRHAELDTIRTRNVLPHFVMKYGRGKTFCDYLRHKGGLSVSEAFNITHQSALEFAHQQIPLLIRRDIKPASIMLEDDSIRLIRQDMPLF